MCVCVHVSLGVMEETGGARERVDGSERPGGAESCRYKQREVNVRIHRSRFKLLV